MTYWRTARRSSGDNQSPGLTTAPDTQRGNVIQLASRLPPGTARLNSRSQEIEPSIHPFEFGSYCLLGGILIASALVVGATCLFYALLVA
jgi:hypothetical protein